MTIVDTLADEHYRDRRRLALEFARIINEEARELVAAGLDVLQLDEPAFNVYMDDVAGWGIEALHRAIEASAARPRSTSATATGSRPTSTGSRRWAAMAPVRADVPAAGARAASTRSRSSARTRGCRCAARPAGRQGRAGRLHRRRHRRGRDARGGRRDDPPGASYVPPIACIPCTNCGMVPLPRASRRGKLQALGAGARWCDANSAADEKGPSVSLAPAAARSTYRQYA